MESLEHILEKYHSSSLQGISQSLTTITSQTQPSGADALIGKHKESHLQYRRGDNSLIFPFTASHYLLEEKMWSKTCLVTRHSRDEQL